MKKFDVEITETLQRKVSVEAASQEDAERMVTQAWNNQDYVMDSSDFTGVDFKTVGEHELAETRTMDVLLVQPNAYPKKISVGTELEDLQAMVGGDIEVSRAASLISRRTRRPRCTSPSCPSSSTTGWWNRSSNF